MRGWGKRASRDKTEVTCRFRLYGWGEHGGQARVGTGGEHFCAPPPPQQGAWPV